MGLRWLAALPITEPRIFRDELLYWQMAKAFAVHQPFLFFSQLIDYPAILYPTLISVAFHLNQMAAFHLAQGLNALLVSAVVFPAYGLAREFRGPTQSLAAAALAGLISGGVYSTLVVEENLNYRIAPPGFEARCPGARPPPEIDQGLSLPVVVLEVHDSRCRASPPVRDVKAAGAAASPAPAPIPAAAAAQGP
jgi:hypothetical protein